MLRVNDNQKAVCAVNCTSQAPDSLRIHNLKTWAEPFDAMAAGLKTWEFRYNDRDYKVGDFLHLMRYDPETGEYTGKALDVQVTYILQGGSFGIPEGYVVMSTPTVKDITGSLQAKLDAAIADMKSMADIIRDCEIEASVTDESCCFACIFSPENTDAIGECPGYDISHCFQWRGTGGDTKS